MKAVETLMQFPRGGVAWGVSLGIVAGVVTSVIPAELYMLGGGALWVFGTGLLVQGLWRLALPVRLLAGWTAMMGIIVAAILAPLKFIDKRIPRELSGTRVRLAELDRPVTDDGLRDVMIDVPSTRPTWREVRAAVEAKGLTLEVGYCGNGASLLFGAYPMHMRIISIK